MAHYLVTGGCGFIGSHLVDSLIAAGHRVRVLDDLSAGNRSNLAPAAELVIGDIRHPQSVQAALDGVDGCFHLAAVVSVDRCAKEWRYAHEVNLGGTLNLFHLASKYRDGGAVPLVYASSAAVYGDARELPISEETPVRPINAYGADKAACELQAHVLGRDHLAPMVGLRFFNVYGPRQDPKSMYSGVVSAFCDRLPRRQPVDIYGDGRQTRDFIHVSDVIAYLLMAMQINSAGGEVYNVCTGNSVSIIELIEMISQLSDAPAQERFHPARTNDIRHSLGDPTRAIARFGYRAKVGLRTGLEELIETLGLACRVGMPSSSLTTAAAGITR